MQDFTMRNVSDTIITFIHRGYSQAECVAWLETRGWSKPAATQFVDRIGRQVAYGRTVRAEAQSGGINYVSPILWLTALVGLASVIFSIYMP